jgi:hypothetical protein
VISKETRVIRGLPPPLDPPIDSPLEAKPPVKAYPTWQGPEPRIKGHAEPPRWADSIFTSQSLEALQSQSCTETLYAQRPTFLLFGLCTHQHISIGCYSLRFGKISRLRQRHGLQNITLTSLFYIKYLLKSHIWRIFMKMIFKANLLIWFSHF